MNAKESTRKHTWRPPLERMLRIHQALQANEYPNAQTLGAGLEVSDRSIRRDIDFMRDRFQLPIEFDSARNGYYYTAAVDAFPALQITQGELFALLVAERALQQYRGTSFERPLMSAIRKLEQSLPETISLNLQEVQGSISFHTRAEPLLDLGIFDALARATSESEQIVIAYRKPGEKTPEERIVDPYHLANINGEWFLFGYDHLRKDLRTFVPARIKEIKGTGKHFVRPRNFSLDRRLRDSFGVRSGEGKYDVAIRFSPRVADYVREKKWHPSQELKERRDGGLDMRMHLSALEEVERWVLAWGGEARVLRPAELASSVRAAAERILKG